MKSLYVIGSLRNPQIPDIAKRIRETGVEAFDSWYSAGDRADDAWKEHSTEKGQTYAEALHDYAAQHVFDFDKEHLDRCDGAVLVYPAGRSCGIEFGYTIGRGKPGWLLLDSPDRWDVMVKFANKGWYFGLEELTESIAKWANE